MFTITFYSYKGGVGRTSALMNVGARLARAGKRICMLDFDLEAPGLDSFDKSMQGQRPGIVEYLAEFLETKKIPDVERYVRSLPCDGSGAMYLIPAGQKNADYQRLLNQLNWKVLYKEKYGPLIIEALKRSVERHYEIDYLLVDSRTGLTDISGICTIQIPDLVVMLFNLNDQNVRGTAQVFRSIKENRLNRDIKTVFVASPIPELPEYIKVRTARFNFARSTIGTAPDIIIPYDPFVAFEEQLIFEEQSKSVCKAYDDLTSRLIKKNDNDVFNLLADARTLLDAGEMQLAELKYQEIMDLHPRSVEGWIQYGRFARINKDQNLALKAFTEALKLLPEDNLALSELTITQLQSGVSEESLQNFRLLVERSRDVQMLRRLSEAIALRGEPKVALDGLERVLELNPRPDIQFENAQIQTQMGEYEAAFKNMPN